MITSVFKKSTPINYTLVVIAVLCFFFTYQFRQPNWTASLFTIGQKIGLLAVIGSSFFLTNFIAKKNALTKDSSYPLLFFFLMLCLFPSVWDNYNLIISNFFLLLASRRLVSLQTLKAPKEKIFDASLWIFIASLFHFWAILFILLVYISIVFHVSRDYRNWLIPFVAFFFTAIVFVFYSLLIDKTAIDYYLSEQVINTGIDYFQNDFQNIALFLIRYISKVHFQKKFLIRNFHSERLYFQLKLHICYYLFHLSKNEKQLCRAKNQILYRI